HTSAVSPTASLEVEVREEARVVGDQAVDAHVDELAEAALVVDGPGDQLDAGAFADRGQFGADQGVVDPHREDAELREFLGREAGELEAHGGEGRVEGGLGPG